MLGIDHVDEVDDDDPAEVAQPQLPRHRLRGLEVGAVHRFLEVALAEEGTGIHVDRGHRLGLVDDQVATGLQRHFLFQRAADLVLDAVQVEDRTRAAVVLDLLRQFRHVLRGEVAQALAGLARVDLDLLHVAADQVAHRAQRQAEVLVHAAADLRRGGIVLDQLPRAPEVGDVLGQCVRRLSFRIGAHDVAVRVARRREFAHQRLQPRAFVLVLDAGGDADHPRTRQQHQVARGNADLGGQPRALAADRVLDHLHHDLGAVAQQFGDRDLHLHRRRGGGRVLAFAGVELGAAEDVVGVQEGGALQADVDERRLHARHHPLHLALVDVADHPALAAALDVQLLQHAVLDHRDAGFARGHVDQQLLAHAINPNCFSSRDVSNSGRPITPE